MNPVVLYLHQVVRDPRPGHFSLSSATTLDRFREMMVELKTHHHPLTMDEYVWTYRNGGRFPARSVVITFDDGFKNNLWAAEILHELGMEATIFVIAATIGTDFQPWYVRFAELLSARPASKWKCSWGEVNFDDQFSRRRWLKATKEHLLSLPPDGRDAALDELTTALGLAGRKFADPDLAYVDAADLRRLVELGMVIGGHSRTHDNLAARHGAQLHDEIVDSSDEIAQLTGQPVRYFSYPDGRYNSEGHALARQRFDAAFAAHPAYRTPDLWRVPRRTADAGANLSKVLSPWHPLERRLIDTAKRVLRF